MRILVLANCNGRAILQTFVAEGKHSVDHVIPQIAPDDQFTTENLGPYDAIVTQDFSSVRPHLWEMVQQQKNVIHFPMLVFNGLTPDQMSVLPRSTAPQGAWGNVSRIMLCGFMRDLSESETVSLYNPDFLALMGYYENFETHRRAFIDSLAIYTRCAEYLFSRWFERDIFFFTGNHPKSFVIEDLLRDILQKRDVPLISRHVCDFMPDPLAIEAINPNLNHPLTKNHLDRRNQVYKTADRIITLEEKVALTFRQLEPALPHLLVSQRDIDRFDAAYKGWTGREPEPMCNPYAKLPPDKFWSRAVARPAVDAVAPGNALRPVIGHDTRVATAGSCFAQHVARAMVNDGLNYYVAEPAPADMSADLAKDLGYGLFSARYGNIYSTRQLLQLIRRAYGTFLPIETAWSVEGGFIDPFRPNIGEVFESVEALETARGTHLTHVRRMFETLSVFVFTLGLTESWIDRRDGAAFPVTPGAVTKAIDPAHFDFLNLDYTAVKSDLVEFLGELFAVNPDAQVIFTVSPVPLIATYGADDVLSASTYSKSVLRAAAGDVAATFEAVQYFPSYEIVVGGFNRGAYFDEDLRGIRPEGVAHVMRVFRERLVVRADAAATPGPTTEPAEDAEAQASINDEIARQMYVVCDEELQVRGL